MFENFYRNRKTVVTGHTGFKGSWLGLWLRELGASVTGISLKPDTDHVLCDLLNIDYFDSYFQDIREIDKIREIILNSEAEIIFHLAAQATVRGGFTNPLETISTNVLGTASLLQACRDIPSVRAIVVVTSDKCYAPVVSEKPYNEESRLGGIDPYSASKSCAELVTNCFSKSFFHYKDAAKLATVRAGNVIGGGDWGSNRIVPDIVHALKHNSKLIVRNPDSTRPWQHVLEPLSGYLTLAKDLYLLEKHSEGAWNFGPEPESHVSVRELTTHFHQYWPGLNVEFSLEGSQHETNHLSIDSDKAKRKLNWHPVWHLEKAVKYTAQWYQDYHTVHPYTLAAKHLFDYFDDAKKLDLRWCL